MALDEATFSIVSKASARAPHGVSWGLSLNGGQVSWRAPDACNDGETGCEVLGGYIPSQAGGYATGEWLHIVGVATLGGSKEVYLNGNPMGSLPAGVLGDSHGGDLIIGDGPQGSAVEEGGAIDELAVYSRALSAAEVATLYKSGVPLGAMQDNVVPSALLHSYSRTTSSDTSATAAALTDGAGSSPMYMHNGAALGMTSGSGSAAATFETTGAYAEFESQAPPPPSLTPHFGTPMYAQSVTLRAETCRRSRCTAASSSRCGCGYRRLVPASARCCSSRRSPRSRMPASSTLATSTSAYSTHRVVKTSPPPSGSLAVPALGSRASTGVLGRGAVR